MSNTNIDYNGILNEIKTELYDIINNDSFYANHDFLITLEQQFIKTRQMQPNHIYIVVKISSASVNYGQTILPVSIQVISEQNKIFTAQKLLFDFVSKYNLARSDDQTTQQIWESPTVSTNFEQMFEGFRSVLYVSGTLVISANANFFKLYYNVPNIIDSCEVTNTVNVSGNLICTYTTAFEIFPGTYSIEYTTSGNWIINGETITTTIAQSKGYENITLYLYYVYGITRISGNGKNNITYAHPFQYTLNKTKAFQRLYNENPNNIIEKQRVAITYTSGGEWQINGENITTEELNKYGYDDFDTLMSDFYGFTVVSGYGTITLTMSFISKYMDIISLVFTGDSQLDPQLFYNTHNFTESIARVGTITFGVSSYLFSDNELMNTCLGIQLKDINTYPLGINTTFKLTISFKNGLTLTDNFKMASLSVQQALGDIPSVSMTFTN